MEVEPVAVVEMLLDSITFFGGGTSRIPKLWAAILESSIGTKQKMEAVLNLC